MANNPDYDVPSIGIAVQILDFLSRYKHNRSTLAEIHKGLNINKSTCLRILRTLKKYGYVNYDEPLKKYGLGISLVVLGARAAEFSDSLEIVKPHLHGLMKKSHLTAVLVQQKSNNRLMYVMKYEPEDPIRVNINVGQYFPVSPSSFGKCVLAFMDRSEVAQILDELKTKTITSKTITNMELLNEELENVLLKGYAVSQEELTLGVTGIASPVFDAQGKVSMIITCLGVSAHIKEDMIPEYGEMIRKTAEEITKDLGGTPPAIACWAH